MTAMQKKNHQPTAHLTDNDIACIGDELDAIREKVMSSRGEQDAAYIRSLIDTQRRLELGSRAALLFSLLPPAWLLGTAGLATAKILENMEIGHNVLHGQWDWMRDPKIHSSTWDWDMASPAEQWKRSHNGQHHVFTNVLGKDHDIGYEVLRMDEDQPWSPIFLPQVFYNLVLALGFEYAIALYDVEITRYLAGEKDWDEFRAQAKAALNKIRHQITKDYVVHPLLSGPSALTTVAANLTANLIRNLWAHSVIFCGHFPEGVQTFETASIDGETRGQWYLRQMLGSANIDGKPLMHLMTGNLSYQIEHHLFPDMPSNRYAEIAPQVRALCARYRLPYTTGPLPKQVASAWMKVLRLSLPNNGFARAAGSLVGKAASAVFARMPGGQPSIRTAAGPAESSTAPASPGAEVTAAMPAASKLTAMG